MTQTSDLSITSQRREQQLRNLRFLETLQQTLAGSRGGTSLHSTVVHRVAAAFDVDAVCLAVYEPITHALDIVHGAGGKGAWDMDILMRVVDEGRTVVHEGTLAVPVLWESTLDGDGRPDTVWGVLAVTRASEGSETSVPYTQSERQLLRAAAERLGTELERRRVYLLDDVLDGLLRKTKPIDVYTHTLRELRRFIRYDGSASIMTMQRGVAQLTVRVEKIVRTRGRADTLLDSPRRGRVVRLTVAQTRYLSRLTVPVELTNEGDGWRLAEKNPDPDAAGLWRVLSLDDGSAQGTVLCYPLMFGGQMLGILRLAAKRPGAFHPSDRYARILDRFARLLSVTLYRSELYHQNDRQLQAIKQIGRSITEPISVEEVCRQVLQLALRVLHVQAGVVGLVTNEGEIELVAHHGCTLAEPPALLAGEGISGLVVQTGKSRAVPDVSREPNYVVFNSRVCSELVAPIIYNGEVIGFLDVESFESGRFREEDEEVITFVEALANQVAIAIKTAQLHEEAKERLGAAMAIDPNLSMAGLQGLLIQELRTKIEQLAAANDHLAAANRAKSEFLAHMSHDLRGPLNVIVGLSSLLVDPVVAPTLDVEKQRESLELIRSNGERLGSLIGNILDLSAVEAGKVHLQVAPFEAERIFAYLRAVATTTAAESDKELAIDVIVDPSITTISADEDKFLRIMQNLIFNAIKFTPSHGRITVTARPEGGDRRSGGDGSLHVIVMDTGIGVAAEDRERIFQPFQQVESSAARQYHGTGLGLTVVRQLVELHGGRVWLEATPGEGSAFHIVLPNALNMGVTEDGMEAGTPEVFTDLPPSVDGGAHERNARLLVLVVEDIPAHMSMMRLAVTSRGYEMHGVGSGEEAFAWLVGHRPDVILLDMQLPDTDGFSVAAHIKSQVETHAIPIIAVTADALSVNEERALASGCDAYLTKPIDIAALLSTIEMVMVQPRVG